ncbi:MAG: MetQ/NlpA family lipoprotein, partial [Vibrio sp.]
VYPIAAYSKRITSLDELQDGARIAVPNDPTNLGRALLLLQQQGLLQLREEVGLLATVRDIVANPKKLEILELDAAQLPRSLDDVALSIINTTYASSINLTPEKDGIFVEDKESPYVNLLVAREANVNAENVQNFKKAYQTDEVAKAAAEIFQGGSVQGW